jgi:hypothetical protein
MIPGWAFPILAHINSVVLVLGSTCLLLMFAVGSALATGLLMLGPAPLRQRWKGWRERRRYGLSLAEWDSRKQIGMPLDHTERLAYDLDDPDMWDDLEAEIWPEGWIHIIEEHRREQEWRQR